LFSLRKPILDEALSSLGEMQKTLSEIHLGNNEHFRTGMVHLEKDPVLASLFKAHGTIDFRPGGDVFESLVESILSQQLAWSAASAIIGRVRDLYPRRAIKPLALYKTPPSRLRKAGVSPQKIRYLKDLSSKVVKKKLDLKKINSLPDAELIKVLDPVLGIGPWTVQMLLIFTLGRPDVLPLADLGIRKAIQTLYSLEEMPKPNEIENIATNWHPYCSIASLYLWRSKDSEKSLH
jgi:DNA-3-methyladenine glycosylase II